MVCYTSPEYSSSHQIYSGQRFPDPYKICLANDPPSVSLSSSYPLSS